jgi:hypothetical protein
MTNAIYMPKALLTIVLVSVLLLVGSNAAYAQTYYTAPSGTMYSVPQGFQQYSAGTYYNSSTGQYYNPTTGQYSTTAPSGPASLMPGGTYNIPAGYSSSVYGTYYSPTAGQYYDPMTGFYSTTAPSGPMYYNPTTGSGQTTPTLPNTGAGGAAPGTWTALLLVAGAAVAGLAILHRKSVKQN